MLNRLSINNYALIDELSIDLKTGFTAITGETGAGKSILISALGLILGERADFKAIANIDKKCIVEGEFNIANYNLESFFENNDLDFINPTLIRREITPITAGKIISIKNVSDSKLIPSPPIDISELTYLGI